MRNRLRFVTVGLLSTALMSIGSALAWADDGSIVLDFIRHGQSIDNAAGIIDTVPPGTALTPTGLTQAQTVGQAIATAHANDIAGIFASEELRSQQTAAQLAQDLAGNSPSQILPGLNEIPAGAFDGAPTNSLEGILYLLAPLSWAFGDVLVPDLGDPSVNGVTFDESFGNAVQTIYDGTAGSGYRHPVRRGILQRRGDRRLDDDERQQPRFLRPAAGAGQQWTVPAQRRPSRYRGQSRGLDAGQL